MLLDPRPHLRDRASGSITRGDVVDAAEPRPTSSAQPARWSRRASRRSRSASCSPTPIAAHEQEAGDDHPLRSRRTSMCRCRARSIRSGASTSARPRRWPTPISARRSSRYLQRLEELSLSRFPHSPRADDEVGWRRGKRGDAVANADPDRDVRPGGRRDRQPLPRRPEGYREPHHLRYRRHQFGHGRRSRPHRCSSRRCLSRAIRCGRSTVDIETIGAGGGSIASVQLGGVLKVGPQSAGAQPGAGLLRPRRHRADADRRARRPRPSQPVGAARRRHGDLARGRRCRRCRHGTSPRRSACRSAKQPGAF